jgi:tRNA A-37 threonylcarbamoyl transferase component Bud32
MEVLQADRLNEVNNRSRTHRIDTTSVEAEWLRELLMDLPLVEESIPAIFMNCDNQTMIIKVNSYRNNMKSTRHVKRRLKSIRKLRNSGVVALDYVHTSKNLAG